MNSRVENKISMWMVLRLFLQGQTSITASLPGFAALLTLFSSTLDEVLTIMNALGMVIKGIAAEKKNVEGLISTKTSEIAGMIKAYAIIAGDQQLRDKVTISRTSFLKMADTVQLAKAQEVHDLAEEMQEDLETYGVTEAEVESLQTLIGTYTAIMPQPRMGIVEHKHTKEELMAKVAEGEETVKKMDAMVEIKRYKEPQFYSDYWASHKIIDTGSRTRSLQLWAEDEDTGEPILKAKVVVKRKGGTDMIRSVKMTGKKGGMFENNLEPGEYTYEVAFGGFVTENGSFFVNDGVMTEVRVKMKRVAVPAG
jgi:hypothetical protein